MKADDVRDVISNDNYIDSLVDKIFPDIPKNKDIKDPNAKLNITIDEQVDADKFFIKNLN